MKKRKRATTTKPARRAKRLKRANQTKPAKRAKGVKRAQLDKLWAQASETNRRPELAVVVGRALLRAAESARRIARMYGTPIYVWEKGRVVAKRP